MIGHRPLDLLHYPGPGDSDLAARLHELSEVVQVQAVRAEIREGVNADNGIEKLDTFSNRSFEGQQGVDK